MGTTAAPARPAPPGEPEPGTYWAAVPAGEEWAPAEPGRTCRFRGSRAPKACGQPAAVRRMRGIARRIAWNYCPEHAYGRWVEDGTVMQWVLRDSPREEVPG